jgi:G:T-mismatch repair DNA endonuclease (very short patch repair protein)
VNVTLVQSGWSIVTVWQCALKGKHKLSVDTLEQLLIDAIRSPVSSIEISGREVLQEKSVSIESSVVKLQ